MRPALLLLLIGATVGPVLDGLHTFSGAIWYPHPQLLRSVWWVPPIFAVATLGIGLGRVYSERVFDRPGRALSWGQVLGAMGLFIGCYAASGFLPVSEGWRALLLVICFAIGWTAWDRTLLGLGSALLCGACGWAVEHALVGHGLFFHRETTLDGIALWLPALYFLAALAIGGLARRLSVEPSPPAPALTTMR